jgi:hypothetical protein
MYFCFLILINLIVSLDTCHFHENLSFEYQLHNIFSICQIFYTN